jgi:16S rRNA processing protein RimM
VTEGSSVERFQPDLTVTLAPIGSTTGKVATVQRAWEQNGELVLQFREYTTRNEAESLRGCDVWTAETERPPAPEGEYYLGDLIGCEVVSAAGETIGTVRAWHDFGAAPLLEVARPTGSEALIPFTSAIYRDVDVSGHRIVVELPEGLLDVNP